MATKVGIQSAKQMAQLVSFEGMLWERNIRPTDIDGFIDFGNRLFIIVELKYGAGQMDRGQSLALERLQDSSSVRCYFIVGTHSANGIIYMGQCFVTRVRYDGEWHEPRRRITVFEAIHEIRKKEGLFELSGAYEYAGANDAFGQPRMVM